MIALNDADYVVGLWSVGFPGGYWLAVLYRPVGEEFFRVLSVTRTKGSPPKAREAVITPEGCDPAQGSQEEQLIDINGRAARTVAAMHGVSARTTLVRGPATLLMEKLHGHPLLHALGVQ